MLATVVNVVPPALTFLALSASLGVTFALRGRRVILWSVLASALVCGCFIAFAPRLSFGFAAYTRDFIYEPLIRDHFLTNPIEGLASAAFHFAIPSLCVLTARRMRQRKVERIAEPDA